MTLTKKRASWIVCAFVAVVFVAAHVSRRDQSTEPAAAFNPGVRQEAQGAQRPVIDAPSSQPIENVDDAKPGFVSRNTAGIEFPDGDVIEVSLRSPPTPPRLRSERPLVLADSYDEFAEAAHNGDQFAAYDLGIWLQRCTSVRIKTRPEFDAAIVQFTQTHQFPAKVIAPWSKEARTAMIGREPTDRAVASLTRDFEFCSGLTDEQILGYVDWFEVASTNGHPSAGHKIGEHGAAHGLNRDQSEQLLLQSWNSGYMKSAEALANLYRSSDGTEPPNHKLVYAYQFIYSELFVADDSISSHGRKLGYPHLLDAVSEEAAKLSPHELAEAQSLAKILLERNENCCYELFN